MDYEIKGEIQTPYLRAIQAIPGDIPGKKLRWIGKLSSCQGSGDLKQVPQELLPLLQVEIAVKTKNLEDITTALKSEDWTIVNRAFKATWFFDGSYKNIVDSQYFCERVFPYVSLKTRVRIVSTLANRLTDSTLAQELFTKVASNYGIQNAYPLIIACDENFICKTIEQQKLVLPAGIVKKMFHKKPNAVVRYLKLLEPVSKTERPSFLVHINTYKFIFPKLVKKQLETFTELFEMHEENLSTITLSNTCAEIFLKKGLHHLIRKPRLYIDILPLRKINEEVMESVFIDLLPENPYYFNTNNLLQYLTYYPQNKKYKLLRESYMTKYGTEILDKESNVTIEFLKLLPAKERFEQARIKIEKLEDDSDGSSYELTWVCYLPVDEAIPIIKERINKQPSHYYRANLIIQMLYTCKINKDDDAFTNVLIYFKNRHKNEDAWVIFKLLQDLVTIYDVPRLTNKKQISLIFKIMQLLFVKSNTVPRNVIEALIHFRFIHGMPIEELIRLAVDSINNSRLQYDYYNMLTKYPQYERKCLITFAEILEQKYPLFSRESSNVQLLCTFVIAIYDFNDRCKTSGTKIEAITIKNFSWLMKIFSVIVRDKLDYKAPRVLQKKEPELYQSWLNPSNWHECVTTGDALTILKRDPQVILHSLEKYFENSEARFNKHVQRFVKSTRWYKDIPIKFAEISVINLRNKTKVLDSLNILAILLHGDSLTKLIEFIMPKKIIYNFDDDDLFGKVENQRLTNHIPFIMKLSNPPVSLELVAKLCQGDYLSAALRTLINVSRRSSFPKVLLFAHNLCNMRVGARKHGIRLMFKIAPMDKLSEFLKEIWKTETHHSIREITFLMVHKLFFETPTRNSWDLYCIFMHMIQLQDEELLSKIKLPPSIPDIYVVQFFEIWLEVIQDLKMLGLSNEKMYKHISKLIEQMCIPFVCNLLSEKSSLAEDIIKNYFFVIDIGVSHTVIRFLNIYLFSEHEDTFIVRSKKFIDIFRSLLKTYWDTPHPSISYIFPYNKIMHFFIANFVITYHKTICCPKPSNNMQLINDMFELFSSVLEPTQDIQSYLRLTYTKMMHECALTNKCFGQELGQHVSKLVQIFSSSLVQFMANILQDFIGKISIHCEHELPPIIEGLVQANTPHSHLMAITMLKSTTQESLLPRYDQLIAMFREMKDPGVTSILNNHFNLNSIFE